MSIFPEDTGHAVLTPSGSSDSALPLAKEYAWDYDNNDFLLIDGKHVIVTGKEAVKVWIWHVFQTERYKYLAYSWNYGHEFFDILGKGLSRGGVISEIERGVKEALLINPYISDVKDIDITLEDTVQVQATVNTVYGEVTVSV